MFKLNGNSNPLIDRPSTGINLVDRYGAYGAGLLGALGALVLALLMPQLRGELLTGATGIAVATFFFTAENDAFVLRILGMVAAGVVLVFALFMPENAGQLTSAAGALAGLAIICGNGKWPF